MKGVLTMEKETFIAVQKNSEGDLSAFKTSGGRILSYEQALAEAGSGKIEGVSTFKGKGGGTYIRSNPDNSKANNLDALPLF